MLARAAKHATAQSGEGTGHEAWVVERRVSVLRFSALAGWRD